MRQLRKTLTNIVKDVTPPGGRANPLTDHTNQDIKDCFAMISEREKELADHVEGKQPDANVISFIKRS